MHLLVGLFPPVGRTRATNGLNELMALAKTTRLATSGSKAAHFAVLLIWLANPLDARIVADGGMERINADDFVELVWRILSDPVGVQDAKSAALATDTLLQWKSENIIFFILQNKNYKNVGA